VTLGVGGRTAPYAVVDFFARLANSVDASGQKRLAFGLRLEPARERMAP